MKKIFVVFLIVPILTFSQDKEIDELRNDLNIVKENLDIHHKQFRNGAIVSIIGFAASITGTITLMPALAIGGGVTWLIGTGIMFDSDKWFGRKYMGDSTGNGRFRTLTEFFYEGNSFQVGEQIIYDKTQEAMIWDILMYKNGTVLAEIKLKNGEKLRVAFTDIKKQ